MNKPKQWVPHLAIALSVVAIGAVVGRTLADLRSPSQPERRLGEPVVVIDLERFEALLRQTPYPTAAPTPTPVTRRINGQLMFDGGRVFVAERPDSGIASAEKFDEGLRVTLTGNGTFRFDNATVSWAPWPSGSAERVFSGLIDGTLFELHVKPGDQWTEFVLGDPKSFGIFTRGTGPPVVNIWVSWRRIEVENGHLYIE